jgi:hypothetical protein
MSLPPIDDVLALVGRLDDTPGDETGRERFRRYLRDHVGDPAAARYYASQCLARTEERYVRALQDLINHVGSLLSFDVTFGKYDWLPGEVAFNGRWLSSWGPHVVIEIRKRESYAGWRPTLARSIDQLIAEGEVPSWSLALGLYVIARPELKVTHLEKAILEEKQALQLRIISLESLFALAELKQEGRLSHQDVLTVLRSSSPSTDWLIELISRLAQRKAAEDAALEMDGTERGDLGDFFEEIGQAVECVGDCLIRTLGAILCLDGQHEDEISDA